MNQQALLRRALQDSKQTRAVLAQHLGVSPRTLAKWLLPDTSKDFRRMPETARRLLASHYGIRKTDDLSMPYDWSDSAMSDEKLTLAVLRRADFPDVVRICKEFGLDSVRAKVPVVLELVPSAEKNILARVIQRMLGSIQIALTEHQTA